MLPTMGEFLRIAKAKWGWKRRAVFVQGPRGRVSIAYAERKGIAVELPGIKPHERLTPNTVRSLCRRLDMPPEDFGVEP